MGLFERIKLFFLRIFSRDPEEARRRVALRHVCAELERSKPPYYRFKSNVVLVGFAQVCHSFCQILKPLSELIYRSFGHPDIRVSQRFFDYVIDMRLPEPERERKPYFSYDGMLSRVKGSVRIEDEFELITHEFQNYLRATEALAAGSLNDELVLVERFVDLCRHDWERLLGLFDPGISLDNPAYRPDFAPCEGEQAVPELIDFHYLIDGLSITQALVDNLVLVLGRLYPQAEDLSARRAKIVKLAGALDRSLKGQLSPVMVLSLCRACKQDATFVPTAPRERRNYVESYKNRLITVFEKDRDRIRRELHEYALSSDIETLFGDMDIREIEGYDEANDLYLQRESPFTLTFIKPLRIIATFIVDVFERQYKEPIKRILVEGYFDNKIFQNNFANIVFQCERSWPRIQEFEESLKGSGRTSVAAMHRYVEEMKRGKDIQDFLAKLVEQMNIRARDIVEDETGLFQMLSKVLGEILADHRKSSPDTISNIRILGGGRNKEIIAQVQKARDAIETLIKIIRNFAFVKAAQTAPPAEAEPKEPEPKKASELPDMPNP